MSVPFSRALAYAAAVPLPFADRSEPVFNIPRVVLLTIVALVVIHGARHLVSDQTDADILARFAFLPGRLALAIDPAAVLRRLQVLARSEGGAEALASARFLLGSGSAQPWTLLTYALLHGSWTHLGLNAIWLLAFGTPVARRLGPGRFVALLIGSTLAGAAAHAAVDPVSLQPLIGASAAVSGCMGAALRFMFRRAARRGERLVPPHLLPRLSLWSTLRDRRSGAFLVVWMVSNAVTGLAAIPLGLSDMPIAWQAHIGGFLFGLLVLPLFDPIGRDALPEATTGSLPAAASDPDP